MPNQLTTAPSFDAETLEGYSLAQVQDHSPKSHIHSQSNVTDLVTDLAAKSDDGHAHAEEDITDLDHDALKVKGVIIDDAGIGDQKVLAYDLASENIVYIEQAPSGAAIASIQHVDISIAASQTEGTAAINEVDLTKSVCYLLGMNFDYTHMYGLFAFVHLDDSTTVEAKRYTAVTAQHPSIAACVLEFSSGIASVQPANGVIGPGNTYQDTTIIEVDLAKAVLFYRGFMTNCDAGVSGIPSALPVIEFIDSTTVRFRRVSHGAYSCWVQSTVLEFS